MFLKTIFSRYILIDQIHKESYFSKYSIVFNIIKKKNCYTILYIY